jgi:hypothetical protein
LGPEELPRLQAQFDWIRLATFSGMGVLSLGLWAGIIEAVRLLLR